TRLESVAMSDSLPQPWENSFARRESKAISRSRGCAEAMETSPPTPAERLVICSCTGVVGDLSVYGTQKMVGRRAKSAGGRPPPESARGGDVQGQNRGPSTPARPLRGRPSAQDDTLKGPRAPICGSPHLHNYTSWKPKPRSAPPSSGRRLRLV